MPDQEKTGHPTPPIPGGQGDRKGQISRSDQAILRNAAAGGWEVPERLKGGVHLILSHILADPSSSPRDRISAIKTLVALDKVNLERLRLDILAGTDDDTDGNFEIDLSPPRKPKDLPERPV